jgi:hypothetical protein
VLSIDWFRSPFPKDWYFWENYLMRLIDISIPKWTIWCVSCQALCLGSNERPDKTESNATNEHGWKIFQVFKSHTKVDSGGYSSLADMTVLPPLRRDKMETFILGKTLKYLYLFFDDSDMLPPDRYDFNTEAHPLPVSLQRTENSLSQSKVSSHAS